MSGELKACPFCGEQPEIQSYQEGYHQVICRDNHTATIEIESVDEWNTRPIEDALQSEIARLTEQILNMSNFHPRAMKLLQKNKPFLVVALDEPYVMQVYDLIRNNERSKGTWTYEDEVKYHQVYDIIGFRQKVDPEKSRLTEENVHLTQRVRELVVEVEESNGLLRSTYQIASRDGKDTNWEAFRNQVHIALVRQHEQMYGEESEEE